MKSKKEQILDISFSLFLEKGYDNTSISDIVTSLDIAREPYTTTLSQKRQLWMQL